MRVRPLALGWILFAPLAAAAAEPPATPDMDLLEFLGSIETDGTSGKEVLTAIDTGLLPEIPEEPPHE